RATPPGRCHGPPPSSRERRRPALPAMEDAENLERVPFHPIRDDIGCNHELARPRRAAGSAAMGEPGQPLDLVDDLAHLFECRPRAVGRLYVRLDRGEIGDRALGPQNPHTRGRRFLLARLQESTQAATFSCGTSRPASASAMPSLISAICQAWTAR